MPLRINSVLTLPSVEVRREKMRQRQKVHFVLMAIAVIALVLAMVLWPNMAAKEPTVAGKPLTYWLEEYNQSHIDDLRKERAEQAIRRFGTNAIPQFLRMLRERDGIVAAKLAEHPRMSRFLGVQHKPAMVQNAEGEIGFRVLGNDAASAVPDLIDIYEHPPSLWSQMSVADSLADMGQAALPAVPALLKGITSSYSGVRLTTLDALHHIRADPSKDVPTLVTWLSDTDVVLRTCAAIRLGRYGPEARNAIPALRKARGSVLRNADLVAIQQIEGTVETNVSENDQLAPKSSHPANAVRIKKK